MHSMPELINQYLGLPYEKYNCWELITLFFNEGKNINLQGEPQKHLHKFHELWFFGEGKLSSLYQWDIIGISMHTQYPIIEHLGIMINSEKFIHSRPRSGVCIENLSRWHDKYNKVLAAYRLIET